MFTYKSQRECSEPCNDPCMATDIPEGGLLRNTPTKYMYSNVNTTSTAYAQSLLSTVIHALFLDLIKECILTLCVHWFFSDVRSTSAKLGFGHKQHGWPSWSIYGRKNTLVPCIWWIAHFPGIQRWQVMLYAQLRMVGSYMSVHDYNSPPMKSFMLTL